MFVFLFWQVITIENEAHHYSCCHHCGPGIGTCAWETSRKEEGELIK